MDKLRIVHVIKSFMDILPGTDGGILNQWDGLKRQRDKPAYRHVPQKQIIYGYGLEAITLLFMICNPIKSQLVTLVVERIYACVILIRVRIHYGKTVAGSVPQTVIAVTLLLSLFHTYIIPVQRSVTVECESIFLIVSATELITFNPCAHECGVMCCRVGGFTFVVITASRHSDSHKDSHNGQS